MCLRSALSDPFSGPEGPVLFLDASLDACVAAVLRGGEVLSRRHEAMRRGHAERIAPLSELALSDAGVAVTELSAVVSTTGPGGFVGARVGPAFARGLALSLGIKARGIGTLEAFGVSAGGSCLVVIPGGRDGFIVQGFAPDTPLRTLSSADAPDVLSCIDRPVLTGPAAAALREALPGAARERVVVVETAVDPRAAVRRALRSDTVPSPVYARPPDAALPRAPLYRP